MPEPSSNPLSFPQRSISGGAQPRTSSEQDRLLLERVCARDQKAMAEIFDAYSGMAYSIALRILKDPAQAEDVIQEVFFQIWQNPKSFSAERGSIGAWLAVVVRNRSIDAIRRRKPTESIDEAVLPETVSLASEVERRAVMQRVRGALDKLPAEQRESVELAFLEGMTHSEIAERKGEPLGTVKTRIRTALISIRKAFQL